MYWQVYLHKTVLSAEKMLVRIMERAKELLAKGPQLTSCSPILDLFLKAGDSRDLIEKNLDRFCLLDDYDVTTTIKQWMSHPDKVLSLLCRRLIDRRLLKVRLQATPFSEEHVMALKEQVSREVGISMEDAGYFVFTGQTTNTTYDPLEEEINILFKNGEVRDISQVDNALIQQTLASPVKKFYLCYLNTVSAL
jgi:HD superfamily phosphohydrolase